MSNDTFDCLVEDIERIDEAVIETLSRLKNREVCGCDNLDKLVHGEMP